MMYGWFGGFGFLWMIVFWGAVIWLIAWVARGAGTRTRTSDGTSTDRALDILEARFARGEIDATELEAKRHDLLRK